MTTQVHQEKSMHQRRKNPLRELDRRRSDGIEVALLWDPKTGQVLIAVEDTRSRDSFEFDVEPDQVLTAFHHPYAYVVGGGSDRQLAA
jgi:hypothetical protein